MKRGCRAKGPEGSSAPVVQAGLDFRKDRKGDGFRFHRAQVQAHGCMEAVIRPQPLLGQFVQQLGASRPAAHEPQVTRRRGQQQAQGFEVLGIVVGHQDHRAPVVEG
jgi:hypothetical protein